MAKKIKTQPTQESRLTAVSVYNHLGFAFDRAFETVRNELLAEKDPEAAVRLLNEFQKFIGKELQLRCHGCEKFADLKDLHGNSIFPDSYYWAYDDDDEGDDGILRMVYVDNKGKVKLACTDFDAEYDMKDFIFVKRVDKP